MTGRAASVQANEARILEAAWRLFAQADYDQVSLKAVASLAAVSVQTVIRHFHNKETLFAACAPQVTAFRDHVAPGDVAAAVKTIVEDYEEIGDRWLHVMTQEMRVEPIRAAVEHGRQWHHEWVERFFGYLLEGLPPKTREQRLAQLTVALDLYSWKILRRDFGLSKEEVKAAVEDLVVRLLP